MKTPVLAAAVAASCFAGAGLAAPAAPAKGPAVMVCAGPEVDAGHKISLRDGLKVGADPKACFGHMSIYGPPDREIVAVAASAKCPGGKAVEVYGKSSAGPWYGLFKEPICGSSAGVGPKDPWGDWMITIDGRNYDNRGGAYVEVK